MALRRTLAEMRQAVRDNVDEAEGVFWDDAQLLRFLNRAKDRVWLEARKLKDDFHLISRASTDGSLTLLDDETYDASGFQIVAGTREYTLPHDLVELKMIECITSGKEYYLFTHAEMAGEQMRLLRMQTEQQTGAGYLWDLVGERTLTLAPTPGETLDLRIWYVPIVPDLAEDDDTLEMPHPLYKAVEEFATAAALQMDRDPNAASWEAKANGTIATFFGSHSRQTGETEYARGFFD